MAEEDMPPFWLQTSDTLRHAERLRGHRLRRQTSSIFLNSGVFLIVLIVIALVFVFVVVPSIANFTSQIFRPHQIKKGWDSLNLVLVLFAIVCGFLSSRSSNSNSSSSRSNGSMSYYGDQNVTNYVQKPSYPSTPQRWYEHQQERTTYNALTRLRSFSSYPDLRQESLERWRFYDDTNLNNYRFPSSDGYHDHHLQQHHHQEVGKKQQPDPEPELEQEDIASTRDVVVDTFVVDQKEVLYTPPSPPPPASSPPPPPSPSSPPQPPRSPPPQPSKVVRRKVKRTYEDLGRGKKSEEKDLERTKNVYIPPPLSPPSPPPMSSQNEKKRGKDFLSSLRRKKKKQRQKSVENFDSLFSTHASTIISPVAPSSTPPPPPPPPPPPHFLQNLFSKKAKPKKIPPPPPPPPPFIPSSRTHVSRIISRNVAPPLESHPSRIKAEVAPVTSYKPPKQVRTSSLNGVEGNADSGNASPVIPIPPPPPFKMPAWKFVLDGDYVRVGSFNSSRSGSPDLDSVEDAMSDRESSPMARKDAGRSGDSAMTMFCPSPDVNTKADNFIARFRAGLNFEKMNSIKGKSNLGPDASTS